MDSFLSELDVALEAARKAGRALKEAYSQFQKIADAPIDISTEADRLSQEIILKYLRQAYPDDALLAEEQTITLAEAEHRGQRVWVVDPIDGTRGFARKNGEFSVMIGFLHHGKIALGVVLEPASDRLTYAIQGGGCWRQDDKGDPIRCWVSKASDLTNSILVQSRAKNPEVISPPVRAIHPKGVIETYSAGIKLALVARGEADLYVNTYEAFHDWDICAGQILVQEAGGMVSGLRGQEIHYGTEGAWQRDGLLASNAKLHNLAITALSGISN